MNGKKTPVVGIVGWSLGEESFGVTKEYLHWLTSYCKVRPLIITPHPEDLPEVDLLVLPGGPDILPGVINQQPSYYTGTACPFRMAFFVDKLKYYVESKTPIFGICLGMQMINSFFGGTLNQHIDSRYHPKSRYNDDVVHAIKSPSMVKKELIYSSVNSRHHQQVDVLGEGLEAIAYAVDSKEKRLLKEKCYEIEAIAHNELPIVGVQWHPESFGEGIANHWFKYILTHRESLLKSFQTKLDIPNVRQRERDTTKPFITSLA